MRGQQHGVGADRAGGELRRARHGGRRRVDHVAGRQPVACSTIRPHEPHSSSTSETQASFSSSVVPKSAACFPGARSSSQNTQRAAALGQIVQIVQRERRRRATTQRTSGGRAPMPTRADRTICASTTDDRSIQRGMTPRLLRPALRHDEGRGSPVPVTLGRVATPRSDSSADAARPEDDVPQPVPPPDDRPWRGRSLRPAAAAVRGTHRGHDRLGDPGTVRGGQPARGGLAGRRHAQPRRAAAGLAGRRGRRAGRPGRAGRAAVRLRRRASRSCASRSAR